MKRFKFRNVRLQVVATPLDNYTAAYGHIEGSPNDMKHKAQLPSGQWITGTSDQQLVNHALTAATQNQEPQKEIPLLKDYAVQWFETYKRPDIRPNTAYDQWRTIQKHIILALGDKRLNEIETATIKKLYTEKLDAGYAQSTIKHIHTYLNQMLASAKEDELIVKSPTESTRLLKTFKDAPTQERCEVPKKDMLQIISQLDKLEPRERLYLALHIYTGMRRSEALGLQWQDIDFTADIIHVKNAITWAEKDHNTPCLGKTKSKAGVRKIPMAQPLKAILSPFRQLSGFIICAKGTSNPITQSMYCGKYGLWAKIKKTIPLIAVKGYTSHQFRHAFATSTAKRCRDIKIVQTLMGHSDSRVTMRYNHFDEERLETAKKCIDGIFLEQPTAV